VRAFAPFLGRSVAALCGNYRVNCKRMLGLSAWNRRCKTVVFQNRASKIEIGSQWQIAKEGKP
jgi:hypothetical protein